MRFVEVNDPDHAITMLCKAKAIKNESVQVYAERLYTLANDTFVKVDKAVVESQLVGFFIDGLYHDFLCMKVMRENPKTFQAAVQSAFAEQNLRKRFEFRSNDHDNQKDRTEELMEIDHIRPQRKCFLCSKGGHFTKHCKSRSVNAIAQVKEPETGEIHCWRCGEVGHLKRNCPKNSRYQYQQCTRHKNGYQGQQNRGN